MKKRRRSSHRRLPPARPALDPVMRYARAVLEGRLVTGRAVKLACRRHLQDLDRQRTPDFPYCFDLVAAQHIVDFFPTFLTLEGGEPFVLTDWYQFCLGSLFGWKRASDGARRFQVGYIETGKGSGKTPCSAGVGLYLLAFDNEQSAEIYSAAFDKGQAGIILQDAIRMASASPELRDLLDIGKYNIADLASGSFFRAVSSEHRSKSGPRPSGVLIDELHEHRDATVVNKMRAGFKFRRQPLLLEVTNAGSNKTSVCWQHHEKSLNVLEGTLADEQWFAYVCQLDPCDGCFGEGYRQPKDGCPRCDDWTDPAAWPKANPSLGVTIQPPYLQTQVDTAISMPSDQALIKRLNFCIWTETHQVWIPGDRWEACRVEHVSAANLDGRPCAAGLDLSSKIDLSALVVAIRFDDLPQAPPAEVVTIDGMNEEGQHAPITITLNFSVELIPFAWIPEETLQDRVDHERIPYDVWVKNKCLDATPGAVIDHQAIYDRIVKDVMPRFKVQRLGYDERDATMLAVKLRDQARLGDKIVAVGQGKKLSEAFKLIEVLVRSRRLRHDGNPVFAWCVANAEPKDDRLKARWLEKPRGSAKSIDLAYAAATAIHQLMLLPAKRQTPRIAAFVA
jgi:phage terminase large subunit-like protein